VKITMILKLLAWFWLGLFFLSSEELANNFRKESLFLLFVVHKVEGLSLWRRSSWNL